MHRAHRDSRMAAAEHTALDEALGALNWLLLVPAVTARLEVDFRRPVPVEFCCTSTQHSRAGTAARSTPVLWAGWVPTGRSPLTASALPASAAGTLQSSRSRGGRAGSDRRTGSPGSGLEVSP